MQSLNFTNVTTDFKAAVGKPTWPSRLSSGLGRVDFERKQQRLNKNCLRYSGIVACASERNSSGGAESKSPGSDSGSVPGSGPGPGSNQSSFLSRSQTYALLKQQMEVAAKSEDYKEAARLRDSLRTFEDGEPVLRLKRLLKEAVDDQRFEDAARYRNELKEIAPHSLLKCSSDATTLCSKKQDIVAQPTVEAKFIAANATVNQVLWLKNVLHDFHVEQTKNIEIFVDNQAAITISNNPVFHGKTKHVNIKLYFLREVQQNGGVTLVYCKSEDQLADLLTKPFPVSKVELLRQKIGVCSS